MTKLDREQLPDSVKILRRVHITQFLPVTDRPDSSTFKDKRGPVSAHRADLLSEAGLVPEDAVLVNRDKHGVVSLEAGFIRSKGLEIHEDLDPDDETCGFAHVLLVGPKSHTLKVELAEESNWERHPPSAG